MNTDVTLNGVDLSTAVPEALVVRVSRQLVGGRRDTFVEVPGRDGAWTFPEEAGDRTLTIEIDLQADTFPLRRAAVRALARWADSLAAPVRLIVNDEPDRFHEATLSSPPDVDEWLTAGAAELVYRVGPYALDLTVSTFDFSASGGSASGTFAVADDEVVAYPVIIVTPTGGTLTALTFDLNGDELDWSGTLADGDTLTLSSISETVAQNTEDDVDLTGAFDGSDLDMAAVSGEFALILPITPDPNTYAVTYAGTATSVDFAIAWRRRYR